MKQVLFLSITVGCLFFGATLNPLVCFAEQKCNSSILASSPDSDFLLHTDGTATDNTTGLIWMRCALGQEWKEGNCQGNAAGLSWPEALKTAVSHEFAGYSDWRLPNKNELGSIVEERCVVPSVNATVFPTTATTFFWTSSPYAGLATAAWSVDFGYGVITATEKNGKIHVRLVRGDD